MSLPLCYGGESGQLIRWSVWLHWERENRYWGCAVENPELITQASARVGCQSVVGVVDVKSIGFMRKYEVVVMNGKEQTGFDPAGMPRLEDLGVGEILLILSTVTE